MKLMRIILFLFFAIVLCHVPAAGVASENSPPTPLRNLKKSFKGASGKVRTYDEWFVQRKEVFTRDPYIWVYNAEFAKDFHMPDRWIDLELKGADAAAYRTFATSPLCGWRGHSEICMPTNLCIVEIYFNHARHPLPWNKHVRWTDLQIRTTSLAILTSLRDMNRAESVDGHRLSPLADPVTGNELDWWFSRNQNAPRFGRPRWHAYDRSAFEDYSLIVLDTLCPQGEVSGIELRPFRSVDSSGRVFHQIAFPRSWLDRINPMIEKISRDEGTFLEGEIKEVLKNNVAR